MKKLALFTFILFFAFSIELSAQFRTDLPPSHDYSGEVINMRTPTIMTGLENFFSNNMEMSHSYSMNFSSFGGNYQNVNAYTNTMEFFFTPKLYGRLDVSLLHSPFGGNNLMYSGNENGPEIMIRNAQLNYQVNDKLHLQLQYQQIPSHYGYGFYNPYRYNRFARGYYD